MSHRVGRLYPVHRMNKRISRLIRGGAGVGLLTLAATLGVYYVKPVTRAYEEEQEEKAGVAESETNAPPEGIVPFTDEQVEKYYVKLGQAGPGALRTYLALPGEIRMIADRVAHVVLPLTGYAQEVGKDLGDEVRTGEIMAVFKSRELAEARSAFAAAQARVGLAQTSLKREKSLYDQKISPQQDLLDAEKEAAEAVIAMRSAEQQLRALGYHDADFKDFGRQSGDAYTRFALQSPMDGRVIEKHLTLGELIKADSTVYVVADLSQVWADFAIEQRDLARVRPGQKIALTSDAERVPLEVTISYVGPMVSADTRTALVRAVADNHDGAWIPGQFVTGKILVESQDVPVMVPETALQTVDGIPSVFVKVKDGFEVRPIEVGRKTGDGIEVLSGLTAGETYATGNTFVLKAQLGKAEAGHEEE